MSVTGGWDNELQQLSAECFPDALRGLFFGPMWAKACQEASAAVTKTNAVLRRQLVLLHQDPSKRHEIGADDEEVGTEERGLKSVELLARRWAQELDDMLLPTIVYEMNLIRSQREESSAAAAASRVNNKEEDEEERDARDGYWRFFFEGGVGKEEIKGYSLSAKSLRSRYPLLFDLMNRYLQSSLRNVKRCLRRLRRDSSRLLHNAERLQLLTRQAGDANRDSTTSPNLPFQVVSVEEHEAEAHCGGQRVVQLQFADGGRLVYKPFGGQCAQLFGEFVEWANNRLPTTCSNLRVRTMQILRSEKPEEDYYWAEFIGNNPCNSEEEVTLFWQRAGALTSAATAMSFSDGHNGNLIADGSNPVIVDCETFFQPPAEYGGVIVDPISNSGHWGPWNQVKVLRTGLVQRPPATDDLFAGWNAAFTHPPVAEIYGRRPAVINEATDRITISYASARTQSYSKCLPFSLARELSSPNVNNEAERKYHPVQDHTQAFCEGFRVFSAVISEHASEFMKTQGDWLNRMKEAPSRVILRPTGFYTTLGRLLVQPSLCRERGEAEKILREKFQRFNEAAVKHGMRDHSTVIEHEVEALMQLDVPYFFSYPKGQDLYYPRYDDKQGDNGSLLVFPLKAEMRKDYFDHPQGSASEMFCKENEGMRVATSTPSSTKNKMESLFHEILGFRPGTDFASETEGFLARALHIGGVIMHEQHNRNRKNKNHDEAKLDPHEIPNNMFSGTAGQLLFFAALFKASKQEMFRTEASRLAEELFAYVRSLRSSPKIEKEDNPLLNRIGGLIGLGSYVYSFAIASSLFEADDKEISSKFLEYALDTAQLVSVEAIERDRNLDVIAGTSGCLLTLLALLSVTKMQQRPPHGSGFSEKCERVLELAKACGDHLLATAHENVADDGAKHYRWKTEYIAGEAPYLTGFSHGQAGIIHSLVRLFDVTLDERYLKVAQGAIAWEDSLYSSKKKNWPDFRQKHERDVFKWSSWCHGAAGICMSRVSIYDHLATRRSRDIAIEAVHNLDTALTTKRKCRINASLDTICCGDLGLIDAMWTCGRKMNSSRLMLRAKQLAVDALKRGAARGYNLSDNYTGLLQGITGIGYLFVRMAMASDEIPCFGLLDPPASGLKAIVPDFRPHSEISLNDAPSPERKDQVEEVLRRIADAALESQSEALLVSYKGRLICEYLRDRNASRETKCDLLSLTKCFFSLAIGMLIDDGKLELDTPLHTFFREWETDGSGKRDIRLKDIMTHTSGLSASDSGQECYRVDDVIAFARDSPMESPPGAVYFYNNKAVNLLAKVIEIVAREPVDEFLERRLFSPLDIRQVKWERDRSGNVIAMSGLNLSAADLLKIGSGLVAHGNCHAALISTSWMQQLQQLASTNYPPYGLLWDVRPISYCVHWPSELLARYRAAGVHQSFINLVSSATADHIVSIEDTNEAWTQHFGNSRTVSDFMNEIRAKQLPVAYIQQSESRTLLTGNGEFGQYLIVDPSTQLVVVRVLREISGGDKTARSLPQLPDLVCDLLRLLA